MNSPKYGDRTAILKRNRPIWQSKDGQEQIDGDESEVSTISLFLLLKICSVAFSKPIFHRV